ncbi:MAG: class I SAM-dependent methyltransferase [Deltaproteobacteria bacterium]|nr:class I SAM-dependent methyltransferase [Deltaproteobacteria bacterium]MBW1939862.1 class I SAM-dependent methyltransferase [Deltaproteobacteria bacterium]MBW2010349.1 class I SAM-dependent methyltransferase [Deltaproteobacteria bacterium]MBW2100261.1 class I SAM-dependent methyltransferase [Deltaproteobacteria bacterium]
MSFFSDKNKLDRARRLFEDISTLIDTRFSVRLWDGFMVLLGKNVDTDFFVSINGPGVLGSLFRKPTYENLLMHYVRGNIGIHGDLIDFVAVAREKRPKKKLKNISKFSLLKNALPFIFTSGGNITVEHEYAADEVGRKESRRDNKEFIQFHYDISNDFYKLFLGKEMQYSCGYFTTETNSIDQAQHDKLDMICRKLRLQPGDKMLDIGCGWGGLICHAAKNYGVTAHGVTLSQKQLDFARDKIKRLGLEDTVMVELRDYATLEGTYDKIASVGMFEHIGIANMPDYFRKINSLLRDRGILMNHGISRHAKASKRAVKKIRPERRLLLKYIFPGSELDNVGHTLDMMEICGFEVHDVEALREHYALTTRHWYRGLMANREEAIKYVGMEKFLMWALYLAGVSIGFADGAMHICQVVATKHSAKGASGLPLTRADLYE